MFSQTSIFLAALACATSILVNAAASVPADSTCTPSSLASPTASAAADYACISILAPLKVTHISTIVPPFQYPFPDGYAATAFGNQITSRDPPSGGKPKLLNLTKAFNISIEYCTPKSPCPKASTVQLLTHGLGFDKSYWDFRVPGAKNTTQYSYIESVLSSGYSTLAWDRLGCGASTAANPYTEIQASVELALLVGLSTLLRAGSFPLAFPHPTKSYTLVTPGAVSSPTLSSQNSGLSRTGPFSLAIATFSSTSRTSLHQQTST
jgi:hypothetical protein